VGSRIGPYQLERRLGEGGMGEVFLAKHSELGRLVALKLLHRDHVRDPRYVERFVREARMANLIRHQHVIDVVDLQYLADGRPYFVMEYVDGCDLYGLWDDVAGLDPARFLRVMIQIADALSAAHRAGVLHRDLKPSNIFLTRDHEGRETVKIVDFGLSKLHAHPDERLTATGEVVATPPYMSPEQSIGEPIDARSDLYSLGVLMWELLVGRRPLLGNSFGEYVLLHATRAIQAPSAAGQSMVPGGVPASVDEVVLRCLGKRPDDRYGSAAELRAALVALGERLAGPASAPHPRWRWPARPEWLCGRRRLGFALAVALLPLVLVPTLSRGRHAAPRPAASAPLRQLEPPRALAPAAAIAGLAPISPADPAARCPGAVDCAESPRDPAIEPSAKAIDMAGLGLILHRVRRPQRHRDPVDARALKDPFGGAE
jgi:serine/threonine-protein kinase